MPSKSNDAHAKNQEIFVIDFTTILYALVYEREKYALTEQILFILVLIGMELLLFRHNVFLEAKMKNIIRYVVWCFLPAVSLFFFQCAQQVVNCRWANESLAIDGQASDWESVLSFDEKLDASYGVQNDGEHLYVAFVTANQTLQRQLMMTGLVLWLNDTGNKEKDVGFKYPRGLLERGMPPREVMSALRSEKGEINETHLQYIIHQYFRDLQVLDSKNQNLAIYTHQDAQDHDIRFELKYSGGNLVYEICIPLQGDDRHPWSFTAVENVGIGFETPEMDRSQMRGMNPGSIGMSDASSSGGGGMRGGRGGGRGGGGMGGPGGDMGGPGGAMRGSQSQAINVWMTATLATK